MNTTGMDMSPEACTLLYQRVDALTAKCARYEKALTDLRRELEVRTYRHKSTKWLVEMFTKLASIAREALEVPDGK